MKAVIYTSTRNINAERHFTNKPTITSYAVSDTEYDFPMQHIILADYQ